MIERSLTRLTPLTCLNVALVVGILANQVAMLIRLRAIDTELTAFSDHIAAISDPLAKH